MKGIDMTLVGAFGILFLLVGAAAFTMRPSAAETHEAQLTLFSEASEDERLAVLDQDNDELADIEENRLSSTDLEQKDSDRDGLPDSWEFAHGLDANDATDAILDADVDGLTNQMELDWSVGAIGLLGGFHAIIQNGLDPLNRDTDGDGIDDGWEVLHELDPLDAADGEGDGGDNDGLTNLVEFQVGSNPRMVDTDGDGLDDRREVEVLRTNPASRDSDGDGLPDRWEVERGLDPADPGDRFADPDGDGLDNSEEYAANTDPNNADTDSDGMPDAWEQLYGLDPLNNDDATRDPDLDGLTNREEFEMRSSVWARSTEPRNADTDGDSLNDGEEVAHDASPFDVDTDDDGLQDFEEVKIHGTNPTKADTDGDDLSDFDEIISWTTDPTRYDTDLDGIGDGDEVEFWMARQIQAQAQLDAGEGTPDWLRDVHPGLTPAAMVLLHGPRGDLDNDFGPNIKDADSDADTIFDGLEILLWGTDPGNPDTDGDGMDDGWETRYGLDPLDPTDAHIDSDNDGIEIWGSTENAGTVVVTPSMLDIRSPDARWDVVESVNNFTNLEEYEAGTNPTNADTDCDGIPDGWEVHFSRTDPETGLIVPDPTSQDVTSDPDKDGERNHDDRSEFGDYTTFEEWWFFTNPLAADTDGDELPDGYEVWLSTGNEENGYKGEWGLPGNGLNIIEQLVSGCTVI